MGERNSEINQCLCGLQAFGLTHIQLLIKKQQHTAEYLVIVVFRAKILHNHREEGNVNTFFMLSSQG